MTAAEPVLLFDKPAEGIAHLTINRPTVLNAMNMAVRDELWSALEHLRDDPDVRVAVFRGAGERAFSAGADISEFGTAPSYVESRRARADCGRWGVLLSILKPLGARRTGHAYGAR